jgi:putative ABC transport system permease protein
MLTLCIGANSAIFSAVDAALLKPLPYPAADRLVSVYELNLSQRHATQLLAPVRLE